MRSGVIYSCPFVPAEWIAAHGFLPQRIMPRAPGRRDPIALPGSGVCPYARAFASEAVAADNGAAIVVSTACDQMRRSADIIRTLCDTPVFVFNVPHTWRTPAAHRTYSGEIKRLGRFLLRLGGSAPTPDALTEMVLEFDAARRAIRDAAGCLPPRRWAELLASFNAGDRMQPEAADPFVPHGVPLALIGGPMTTDSLALYDLAEQAGGWIALDATETGERALPAPVDRRLLAADPLAALCDAYFGAIPDAFRRPNSELYRWIERRIGERGIRGIVYRRYVWCDNWHAESRRMRDWAARTWPAIGFLDLDAGDDGFEEARALSRLQAFVEVLR